MCPPLTEALHLYEHEAFQGNKDVDTILLKLSTLMPDAKFITGNPHIRECFESIPTQLAKENKKFQYATIKKGAHPG